MASVDHFELPRKVLDRFWCSIADAGSGMLTVFDRGSAYAGPTIGKIADQTASETDEDFAARIERWLLTNCPEREGVRPYGQSAKE